ncbi:hypothetical protein BV22DRAFT_1020929, partial [Leucogyrophana mollusca]
YDFETSEKPSVQVANRRLVMKLKDNFGLLYRVRRHGGHRGLLEHKIFQTCINLIWFRNKQDVGVVYNKYLNLFPITGLALVIAAIECCVDEWTTGSHSDVAFTEDDYKEVYEKHLTNLLKFEEHTKAHNILPRLLQRFHNNGQ